MQLNEVSCESLRPGAVLCKFGCGACQRASQRCVGVSESGEIGNCALMWPVYTRLYAGSHELVLEQAGSLPPLFPNSYIHPHTVGAPRPSLLHPQPIPTPHNPSLTVFIFKKHGPRDLFLQRGPTLVALQRAPTSRAAYVQQFKISGAHAT